MRKPTQPSPLMKGKPLVYNASHAAKYRDALAPMIAKMVRETEREIRALFDTEAAEAHFGEDANIGSQARIVINSLSDRFALMFSRKADTIAPIIVQRADSLSLSNVKASLAELSGGSIIPKATITPSVRAIMKASIAENVSLIQSIATDYMQEIGGMVYRSITTGNGLADLIPQLQERGRMTQRRAALVAGDQTRKVYSALNRERMIGSGIKEFEWLHSGGSQRPRKDHVELNGKVFRLDAPPIIDKKTGERGVPGQLINCKCQMRPVLNLDDALAN